MHNRHGDTPSAAARKSDEARTTVAQWPGQMEQESGHLDSAARAERDQRDKAIATARARAALAGFTMHLLPADGGGVVFLLTKWHLTRELPDLAAVSAFLDQALARDA